MLEEASTLEAGFDPENIAGNAGAMSYREKLQARQDQVAAQIQAVTGEALDIVWNLTLAANLISAQVEYGQMEQIASLPGVEKVILETRYTPDVVSTDTADPDMSTSSEMIGSSAAWSAGYTGRAPGSPSSTPARTPTTSPFPTPVCTTPWPAAPSWRGRAQSPTCRSWTFWTRQKLKMFWSS